MPAFDSRNTEYKKPFGAVAAGETVDIVFPAEKRLHPEGVFMVLRGALDARIALDFLREDGDAVYYTTAFIAPSPGVAFYRFEIATAKGFVFVGRDASGKAVAGDWLPEWQLTVYDAGYATPDWLKGGLIYHIFADRFARVEDGKKPRFGYLKSWNEDVEVHKPDGSYAADDFFGGNIKGILSRLDYLVEMGVTALYLSPIFESSSNHRYDTADYTKIDPLFGTEEEFAELVTACGQRGIGIILDGVFNHTGADSIYFNKFGHYSDNGAYLSKTSPYRNWYTFYHYPDGYVCWWGIKSVPSVRRDSEDFQDLIAGFGGIVDRWTSFGVKGWRLDVVDELMPSFVKKLRQAAKRQNGDTVLIGEVWEDASTKVSYSESREYLFGHELDGVMNYPFRKAILEYVKTSDAVLFADRVNDLLENYPKQALDCCMTLIGTHDTVRALNALSDAAAPPTEAEQKEFRLSPEQYERAKKRLKLAAALQYFLPGVPSVYYGDEIAMQGFGDPQNRRPYPWQGHEGADVLAWYRRLGALRKEYREDFCASASVSAFGSAIAIRRGRLTLYLNAGNEAVQIEPDTDLLTGETAASVAAESAVVARRG